MVKKKTVIVEEPIIEIEPIIEEPIVEKEKELSEDQLMRLEYDKFFKQAKDNYLIGFTYPIAMKAVRYIERKKNITLGLNMSCGTCILQLVRMLDNLLER